MPVHRLWAVAENAATDCLCGLVSAWDVDHDETAVGAGAVARATLLIWCWHGDGDAVAVISLWAEGRVALVKKTEFEAISVVSVVYCPFRQLLEWIDCTRSEYYFKTRVVR